MYILRTHATSSRERIAPCPANHKSYTKTNIFYEAVEASVFSVDGGFLCIIINYCPATATYQSPTIEGRFCRTDWNCQPRKNAPKSMFFCVSHIIIHLFRGIWVPKSAQRKWQRPSAQGGFGCCWKMVNFNTEEPSTKRKR